MRGIMKRYNPKYNQTVIYVGGTDTESLNRALNRLRHETAPLMKELKMKRYFESVGKNGFDFAYVYPGMNKIMQAAGRVIRSENDVGLVVFIDDRFSYFKYKSLLKEQYKNAYYIKDIEAIERTVDKFWLNHKH